MKLHTVNLAYMHYATTYSLSIIAAAIGFVLFSVVVKRYKYRQRDERPYDQRFAEQYYHRRITERIENSECSQTERSSSDVDIFESLNCDYGAIETDVELSDSSYIKEGESKRATVFVSSF